jgi:flagellar basal body-associated protein FliL
MKRLDRIVEQDPLKLKKFDGNGNGKSSKALYIFLIGIFVMLILSFVFYVLAYLTTESAPEPVV